MPTEPNEVTPESASTTSDDSALQQQIADLATHLETRMEIILQAWRRAVTGDTDVVSSRSLSRVQLTDHVPIFLEVFVEKLREAGTQCELSKEPLLLENVSRDDVDAAREHGELRWQQGYDVGEVAREFGHLHVVLSDEIGRYGGECAAFSTAAMHCAHHQLAALINSGVEESIAQYTRYREEVAAERLQSLEAMLEEVRRLEVVRGETMRAASHDMRGSLTVVEGAASMLLQTPDEPVRADIAGMLQRSIESLQRMVGDFMTLARLESGREKLQIASFDVAMALRELCENSMPLAANFGLSLECEGPDTLMAEGDQVKVVRIAQNLLLNALKYTHEGCVSVKWGEVNAEKWRLCVEDTGPGIDLYTASGDDETGKKVPTRMQPGEGIGLAIVKRLSEIVDAHIEVTTSSAGTQFVIDFPRRYNLPKSPLI